MTTCKSSSFDINVCREDEVYQLFGWRSDFSMTSSKTHTWLLSDFSCPSDSKQQRKIKTKMPVFLSGGEFLKVSLA